MPETQRLLQFMDYGILGAGVAGLVFSVITISRRALWPDMLRLPSMSEHRFEAADVLFSLVAVFYLPAAINTMVNPPAASQPASAPAVVATARQLGTLAIAQAGVIVLLSMIAMRRVAGGFRGWGLTTDQIARRCLQAIAAYVLITPICFGLLEGVTWLMRVVDLSTTTHASISALQDSATPPLVRGLTVFNALVLASIIEEMLFRGILLPAVARWSGSTWTAVLVTSALFGFIHYPYVDTIIPLAAFGVLLGWMYARSGSLTLVILAHAVFNAKTLAWLLLGANA